MRIRVYEAHENVAKPPSRRGVSKSTAERMVATVFWKRIDKHRIQARSTSEIAAARPAFSPLRIVVRYFETFDYDYPDQQLHPELALIPALRYPVDLAPRCYGR